MKSNKNLSFPSENTKKLTQLLKNCDGIGISGTNENASSNLKSYSKTKKIRAIHASLRHKIVQIPLKK